MNQVRLKRTDLQVLAFIFPEVFYGSLPQRSISCGGHATLLKPRSTVMSHSLSSHSGM